MSYYKNAEKLKAAINIAGSFLTDEQALKAKDIYEQWERLIGTAATKDLRFLYGTDLYKVIGAEHVFSAEWVPGVGTESLYARIDETHLGTIDDPIPYNGNMELIEGLYYSQNDIVYLCIRNTEQPVYHDLKDLVGNYVEIATE